MGSLVKSLMQILVKLNVLHTYQFFLSYYKILDRVQSGNNATITVMRLLYVNILLKGVHFVWLFFRNDHLSTRKNLMHYNIMGIEHMPAFFNIFAASLFYLVLQIMLQLMFRNTGISGVIIRGCIVNGTSRFMTSTFSSLHWWFSFFACSAVMIWTGTRWRRICKCLSSPSGTSATRYWSFFVSK